MTMNKSEEENKLEEFLLLLFEIGLYYLAQSSLELISFCLHLMFSVGITGMSQNIQPGEYR
jgi:hypothetical protein